MILAPRVSCRSFTERLAALAQAAPGRSFLAGVHRYRGDELRRLGLLAELGEQTGAPLVAINDVHYHVPERRVLADVLTCIREKCTIAEAGFRLAVNAERHLKAPAEMARLFAPPSRRDRAHDRNRRRLRVFARRAEVRISRRAGAARQDRAAASRRPDLGGRAQDAIPRSGFPNGIPEEVKTNHEPRNSRSSPSATMRATSSPSTTWSPTRAARTSCARDAARRPTARCASASASPRSIPPRPNSCSPASSRRSATSHPTSTSISSTSGARTSSSISTSATGATRAAICATVIHYRSRRAIREVGKVLGLTPDVTAALAKTVWGYGDGLPDDHIRQAGLDPQNPAIRQAAMLANEIIGFPRHLSQHVGGFVLTRERLDETVPIGNAAMDERTFIEWDKDDIDTLGLMKVDVLALGMLSCLRRGLDLAQAPLRQGLHARHHPAGRHRGRARGLRGCCRKPTRSACSRSRAARRCRCCRASSRNASTTS